MKSFFVNAIAKKTVALLLVLAIAVGVAFAAPLAPKAGFGDAKVYDSSYKAVQNPTEVSDGFVLRTANSEVTLEGPTAGVVVEGNSLLQFENLGDTPKFYLLDGRGVFSSSSAFEVRTTVTEYRAETGTEVYIITDDAEETAYVEIGKVEVTNLITGEVSTIGEGTFINNAKSSNPAATTKESYWAKPATEAPAAETPAAEAPAEQPAAEAAPAETKPEETKPAEQPVVSETVVTETGALQHTFEYRGFKAVLSAYIGVAELEYPAFVTNEELDAAARAAVYTFPQFTTDIQYEIVEPGFAKIYYPESYGKTEFDFAVYLLEQELAGYIDAVLGLEPEQPVEEPAAEQPQEEVVLGALVKDFSHRGIEARIEAYIGECDIYYPQFVTNEEIDAAAAAAVWKYPEYTQGITYVVVEPGHAKAYYPVEYGPDEFHFAMGLLESELYAYIDELFARYAAAAEPVAEEPAAEQAPEAPAEPQVEKTPIETAPKAEEPVAEPVVEQEPEKKFRFGANIEFIYGRGDRGDYFADPMFLHERAGVFMKNYMVIVDPIFTYGDFKFGLHLVADIRSGKLASPFVFKSGATGIINTVMRFISVLSFNKGNFSINVDRKSELEFRSPIFSDLSRSYDLQDKLLATMKFETGEFGFTAFVDDLQLENKLQGRSQFAGARAFFKVGKMQIGLSIVADLKNGFKDIAYYPGGDAVLPFTIKGIDFALEGGAVASFRKTGKAAMIEGQFKKTSGLITFGIGGAYSVRYNFNDLINNGPTSVISTARGKSIDVIGSVGINTKFFRFRAEARAPFAIKGDSRLVYNTVLTKYGNTASITADTMNVQADVLLGKFTFTAGAVFNGFAGRVANLLKAIKNGSGRRAALAGIVDPEVSTIFAEAKFAADISSVTLSLFVRADVMTVKSKIAVPVSAGIGLSF